MRKKTSILLMMLLAGLMISMLSGVLTEVQASTEFATDMPVLFIDPLDPSVAPGDDLIVSVMIFNLTDYLFGLDIIMSWDPTILNYTSHTKTIPANTTPSGILYAPTLPLVNEVDEVAGTYNVAEATMGGPAFNRPNGNSTVFIITFKAIALGICNLTITASDLARPNPPGGALEHQVIDSDVTVIPEFPSVVILPLLISATLLVALIRRKKHLVKTI